MDERSLGWFERMFHSFMRGTFHKDDYFRRLTETVPILARQGSAIFIGRAADLILPKDKGLRVKIIASREYCARNFARRGKTSIAHARREVERIELDRRNFIQEHFHIDAYEPTRFDLLINVERFDPQAAADLIVETVFRTSLASPASDEPR